MAMDFHSSTAASKGGSIAKMTDSRFKMGTHRGAGDALGGFQSILSAAADASSEIQLSGIQAEQDDVEQSDSPSLLLSVAEMPQPQLQSLLFLPNNAMVSSPASFASSPELSDLPITDSGIDRSALALQALILQTGHAVTTSSSQAEPLQMVGLVGRPDVIEQSTPQFGAEDVAPTIRLDQLPAQSVRPTVQFSNVTFEATPILVQPSPSMPLTAVLPQPDAVTVASSTAVSAASRPTVSVFGAENLALNPAVESDSASALPFSAFSAVLDKTTEKPTQPIPFQKNANNSTTVSDSISSKSNPQPVVLMRPEQVSSAPILTPPAVQQSPMSTISFAQPEMRALEGVAPTNPRSPIPVLGRLLPNEKGDESSKSTGWSELKPVASGTSLSRSAEVNTPLSAKTPPPTTISNNTTPEVVSQRWVEPPSAVQVALDKVEPSLPTMPSIEREASRQDTQFSKNQSNEFRVELQNAVSTPTEVGSANSLSDVSMVDNPVPVENYVADQVSYWISKDIQSASLQLDGLGTDPVQVQISMQGNEAYVTFNTDELQAREALENAREQLQNMLQSQGITLTGMSIGGQGTGDQKGQERDSSQSDRKQSVKPTVEASPRQNEPKVGQSSGSTLDLFV